MHVRAQRTQSLKHARARTVEPDALDLKLRAFEQRGRSDEERSRRDVPRHREVARFEPRMAFKLREEVTGLALSLRLKSACDLDAEPAQHSLRVVARRLRLAHARAPLCAERCEQYARLYLRARNRRRVLD